MQPGRADNSNGAPLDPVYLTYIYNSPDAAMGKGAGQGRSHPFRPATQLSRTEMDLQYATGVYEHFHAPRNEHNRFSIAATPTQRSALRQVDYMPPQPFDKTGGSQRSAQLHVSGKRAYPLSPNATISGSNRVQQHRHASSAPSMQHADVDGDPTTLLDNMTTQTGVPCFTVSALIEADVDAGQPVTVRPPPGSKDAWKVARVLTYEVPTSSVGYGEGGARPYHQDYRHYKYFGFAGKGAKTSWAHNPKYSLLYQEVHSKQGSGKTSGGPPAPPFQESIGAPPRPLTHTERSLIGEFQQHNYTAEGSPSDVSTPGHGMAQQHGGGDGGKLRPTTAAVNGRGQFAGAAAGRPASSPGLKTSTQQQQQQQQQAMSKQQFGRGRDSGGGHMQSLPEHPPAKRSQHPEYQEQLPPAEIIEPHYELVDVITRTPIRARRGDSDVDAARVATYRMVAPTSSTLTEDISPNHGSQSPFHQRYSHYKYNGFAGKGATSSWARNPKLAVLYD